MAKSGSPARKIAGIGAGIAAAAVAAAAGAYFLYGKHGAQHRKKIKGWMLQAKGEVLEQLENLNEISEKAYNEVIDKVAKSYRGFQNVDKTELAHMVQDLKRHWKTISRELASKKRVSSRRKSR